MTATTTKGDSNPVLDFALNTQFQPFSQEEGLEKIVAFGDHSHKCPVYLKRTPPCQHACPANEDIRGYNNLLRGIEKYDQNGQPITDKWAEAFYRITDKNPFPGVMGRVCPALCQTKCNRQHVDETVGINSIEHAIGDYAIEKGLKIAPAGPDSGKHVAIVGAGPSGLSAAYQLRRKGHKVTIYEMQKKPGGMVRYGIMGYRVDRSVLDKEIQRILDLGVEVKYGVRIGQDATLDDLRKKYDAVYLAIGAQKGRPLPIPGAEGTPRVTNAISFLMEYEREGSHMHPGKNIVVIGDGNVAMDVARLGLRLGSKASIVSGVPENEMNCFPEELRDAKVEGADFHYQVGTVEVIRDGDNVKGLKCIKMQKKEKGEDGWNHPVPFFRYKAIPGTEFVVDCDLVVAAIGQGTDTSGFEAVPADRGLFKVEYTFQVKGMENVFAGGDILQIDLITTAVGQGRKAAESIDKFVRGEALPAKERADVVPFDQLKHEYFLPLQRNHRHHIHPTKVEGDWKEILQKLESGAVEKEAERCMSCGLCFECKQCMLFCPQEAISMNKKNPIGEVMFTDYVKCVGCHICAESCPTAYIRMGSGEDL